MLKIFKLLIGFLSLIPSYCYKTTDLYYQSNNIDIYIEDCPTSVDCIPLIIETAHKWMLPGISFNINWIIKDPAIDSSYYTLKNEISFKHNTNHYGFTVFQSIEKAILNFKIFISPYGITQNVLYNILLHEFGHVFLLQHSFYKDSVMGYKILTNLDKTVNIYQEKITFSDDDVSGIYSIELAKHSNNIKNIAFSNYLYSLYLQELERHPHNSKRENNIQSVDLTDTSNIQNIDETIYINLLDYIPKY